MTDPVGALTGSTAVALAVFAGVTLLSLVAVTSVSRRNRTAEAFYTGGGGFDGRVNGIALTGDYLSAAAVLGVIGTVAGFGYDGIMVAIGSLTGWVLTLLFVGEPMRNVGRFTLGDVLSYRLRARPVRAAAAAATLLVSLLYLVANIAGAGELVALLADIPDSDRATQSLIITGVGVLMTVYVLVGGMTGTTLVQIIKATLLLTVAAGLAVWVLGYYFFDVSRLLGATTITNPGQGQQLLAPGLYSGTTPLETMDFLSLGVAGMLGPASLPHLLTRLFTVPDGRQARRSVAWAIGAVGGFFLCAIVIGLGASALLGGDAISSAPGGVNAASGLLAYRVGGAILLGLFAAVAFATVLAVVAGLTITAAASFAHDIYANLLRRGRVGSRSEVRVARLTALVVGILATAGGIAANGQNIAALVGVLFAVAASTVLPALLYGLYWRRFTTAGALACVYGGAAVTLTLIAFSPLVSGRPDAFFPGLDFAWFPMVNPGAISVPAAFVLGAVATLLSRREPDAEHRYAEMQVRALTGAATSGGSGPSPTTEPIPHVGPRHPRAGAPGSRGPARPDGTPMSPAEHRRPEWTVPRR
ncbi:MAG: cation acetate symporter [Pseudonocardia sp.]|nr:cation acetate symporter [Pseudonocardia sp.]